MLRIADLAEGVLRERSRIGIVVFLGATALLWSGAALAQEPPADSKDAIKCESKKNMEAAKYAQCLLKQQAKAVKKGTAPDFSKCDAKLQKKWGKIEEKAEGACPSQGDQAPIQGFLGDCGDCIADLLAGAAASCACDLSRLSPDACAAAGGVTDGGACWFPGVEGHSCDHACAAVGLVYDPATATHAGDDGSGGTPANCYNVLALLGVDYGTIFGADAPCLGAGVGCASQPGDLECWRCNESTTNAAGAIPMVARACACQEP